MIRRVNSGKSHYYIDTETEQRIPGVTGYLDNGVPKPALINWSASATAEYAVDHWDELADMAPSERLRTLNRARYLAKDAAAKKGTKVHALAERLVQGEKVDVPDELAGHVASYVRFLDEFDVQPVLVERTVHSAQHNYCGTFDLVADIIDPNDPEPEQRRWLLDIKTSRSGIFGETALQLAAYRYADVWIDEDEQAEYDMPEVEFTGGVHVRSDGYSLIPLETGPAQLRQFLYVQQVAGFIQTSRDLVGPPLESPETSTYTLQRIES